MWSLDGHVEGNPSRAGDHLTMNNLGPNVGALLPVHLNQVFEPRQSHVVVNVAPDGEKQERIQKLFH